LATIFTDKSALIRVGDARLDAHVARSMVLKWGIAIGTKSRPIKIHVSFDNVCVVFENLINFLMNYGQCQPFCARSAVPCSQRAWYDSTGPGDAKLAVLNENNPDFAACACSASPCALRVAMCTVSNETVGLYIENSH
jgi:hypothetical protein